MTNHSCSLEEKRKYRELSKQQLKGLLFACADSDGRVVRFQVWTRFASAPISSRILLSVTIVCYTTELSSITRFKEFHSFTRALQHIASLWCVCKYRRNVPTYIERSPTHPPSSPSLIAATSAAGCSVHLVTR